MHSRSNSICLYLVLFIFGAVVVHGEPDPMARPTRPEIFTSPEELRRYLDHVSDYYSHSGKARYGKRGHVVPSVADVNYVWDTMKTVLMENSQRSQLPKLGKRKQEESRFLSGELGSYDSTKEDTSRTDTRPCHVLDTIEKYYGHLQ